MNPNKNQTSLMFCFSEYLFQILQIHGAFNTIVIPEINHCVYFL